MNTVQPGDTERTLTWNNIGSSGPNIVAAHTFARVRLTNCTHINMTTPGGEAHDGDVEDYALTIHSHITGQTGGGQAHENMQPSLAVNYCIALQGLFQSRN